MSVEITNQSFFVLDSWNYERFVVKKSKMKINAVELMYEELCYKISTQKYEKPNSNINIYKNLHLTFNMVCNLLEKRITQWSIHLKSAGTMKQPMV